MKLNKKLMVLAVVALAASSAFAKKMQMMDWIFRAPSVSNPLAVDPATIGDMLFDTSDSNFKGWNGSAWISLGGAGSGNLNVRSVSTTDTATTSDDVLILSSSSFTETLYSASGNTGKVLKLLHNGTNFSQVYTLQTTGGETIGGVASGSYALYTNGETLTIVSDGSNWQILDHKTITGWTSYTATFTGFGTVSTQNMYWRRVGDSIQIRGRFVSGTPTSTEARVSIPVTLASTITSNETAGVWGRQSNNGAAMYELIMQASTAYFLFGYGASDGSTLAPRNGNDLTLNTNPVSVRFEGPVAGWQP